MIIFFDQVVRVTGARARYRGLCARNLPTFKGMAMGLTTEASNLAGFWHKVSACGAFAFPSMAVLVV